MSCAGDLLDSLHRRHSGIYPTKSQDLPGVGAELVEVNSRIVPRSELACSLSFVSKHVNVAAQFTESSLPSSV
jgi:hypothetical protein